MSAARNAEPIPNATTRARDAVGRAMSGRIGISLASTVSNVIEVPATQSSGVKVFCPAWTDAISSSVEANTVGTDRVEIGLVRLDEQPRDERRRRRRPAATTSRWPPTTGSGRGMRQGQCDTERGIDDRQQGDDQR